MAMVGSIPAPAYRILVSRSHQRPVADLYGFALPEPIPNFPLPLNSGEAEPVVKLQEIFSSVYERRRHNSRIDYRQQLPALSEAERYRFEALLSK